MKTTRKLVASLLVLLMTLLVPAIALAGSVEGGAVSGHAVTIGEAQSVTLTYSIQGAVGSRTFSIPTSATLGANGWTADGSQSINASNSSGNKTVTASLSVTVEAGAPSGAHTFSVPYLHCGEGGSGAALNCGASASVTVNVPVSDPPTVQAHVSGTQGSNGWFTGDVTVTWTVTGATSSTGCAPTTINTDTAGTDVTCSATNAAGTTTETETIRRDATVPTIAVSAVYADDETAYTGGWTNRAVKVNFSCSDAMSGIAGGCPGSVTLNASDTVTRSVSDMAGNSASAVFTVQIDTILPTITANAGDYVSGTWTNQSVTVSFTCGDEGGSGLAGACPESILVHGGVETVSASVTDNAGNEGFSNVIVVKIDKIAPTITMKAVYAGTETPYTGGWTNQTVEVSFTCDDQGGSGLVGSCPEAVTVSESGTESIPAFKVVDAAGNESGWTSALTIQVDKEAPEFPDGVNYEVTEEATGPIGAIVTFAIPQATDNLSGVTVSCDWNSGDLFPLDTTVVTCTATDGAGNQAVATITISVQDTTDPEFTSMPSDRYIFAGAEVSWTLPTATDTVTENVQVSCDEENGGVFNQTTTVTCTATDGANNSVSESFTIYVVTAHGGMAGSGTYKHGSTVPMRYTLDMANASAGTVYLVATNGGGTYGGPADEGEEITTQKDTGNMFRWDGSAQQWVLNFDSGKVPEGSYNVYVSVPGIGGQLHLGSFTTTSGSPGQAKKK